MTLKMSLKLLMKIKNKHFRNILFGLFLFVVLLYPFYRYYNFSSKDYSFSADNNTIFFDVDSGSEYFSKTLIYRSKKNVGLYKVTLFNEKNLWLFSATVKYKILVQSETKSLNTKYSNENLEIMDLAYDVNETIPIPKVISDYLSILSVGQVINFKVFERDERVCVFSKVTPLFSGCYDYQ